METAERREAGRYVPFFLWEKLVLTAMSPADKAAVVRNSPTRPSKDGEELDQVVGNAEDEIGDRIAGVRETELLFGPESLLAIYGPMIVHICGSPHKFKVRYSPSVAQLWRPQAEATCRTAPSVQRPHSPSASFSA